MHASESSPRQPAIARRASGLGLGLALVCVCTPALAHVAGHHHSSALHALAHPFGGLDHLLAILVVTLWARAPGPAALRALPLVFLLALAAGLALYGPLSALLPPVVSIVLALILPAGALAVTRRPGIVLAAVCAALLGLFQGHAHGADLGASIQPDLQATALLAGTAAALALAGVLAWRLLAPGTGVLTARLSGAGLAATGTLMLHGV